MRRIKLSVAKAPRIRAPAVSEPLDYMCAYCTCSGPVWVKGVSLGRSADRQPIPRQETLRDRMPHFGSSSSDRVEDQSAHVRRVRCRFSASYATAAPSFSGHARRLAPATCARQTVRYCSVNWGAVMHSWWVRWGCALVFTILIAVAGPATGQAPLEAGLARLSPGQSPESSKAAV